MNQWCCMAFVLVIYYAVRLIAYAKYEKYEGVISFLFLQKETRW